MINLFGDEYTELPQKKPKATSPQQRAWENGFQKWSDDEAMNGTHHYGACAYGAICDYCVDNSYGRPCVRALNSMCRDKHLIIDYSDKSNKCYEKWFDGKGR